MHRLLQPSPYPTPAAAPEPAEREARFSSQGSSVVEDGVLLEDFERILKHRCCSSPSYGYTSNAELGAGGSYSFQCACCLNEMAVRRTSKLPSKKRGPNPDATTRRLVAASKAAGMGLAALNKFMLAADLKPMNPSVYYAHSSEVAAAHGTVFTSEMEKNLKREIELTIEREGAGTGYLKLGDDEKAAVLIKVITDGSWQKRYGRNSLFGYGVMYGFYSGLPVFASHRCARCMVCIKWNAMSDEERPEGEKGEAPPPPHDCSRNWGSLAASNMEADIAVEGAKSLLASGAGIGVLVCDGDTKTATKIRSDVPELKEHVEIWNDLNHMSINVGKQLREETELSEAEATKLQSSFYRAVKQAREEEKVRREKGEDKRTTAEQIKFMRRRIVAAIQHYFNKHTDCGSWCVVKEKGDTSHVPAALGKYITSCSLDDVMPIIDTYTTDGILQKLLEDCTTNTAECGNSVLWCNYLPKDKFRPREGKPLVQRVMLTRSKGEGAVQTAIENELGLASAPVTIERRERMDASMQKKRDAQKTDEYKRKRANKKEKRKTTTKAKDKNHNGQNHKKQDSGKGKKTKCTVCLRVTCPRTKANPCEYKKEYSKPKCPFPTRVMEEGTRVAFVDMEFQNYPQEIDGDKERTITEFGAVAATYNSSTKRWTQHKPEFQKKIKVKRFDMKTVKRLKQEDMVKACRGPGALPVEEAFDSYLTWMGDQVAPGQQWALKGHNFVSADMRHWIEHLKNAGVEDPIKKLKESRCAGIIDGMRFIKKHESLRELRNKKRKADQMEYGEPLGNAALYQIATKHTMEGGGLRPHRAIDDAKAEREWTTNTAKLGALTKVLVKEKVVVTLDQYREYHEQYEKRVKKLKELGTFGQES